MNTPLPLTPPAAPAGWRSALFPDLAGAACRVDLNAEAQAWAERRRLDPTARPNPFLDPATCGELLGSFHRTRGVAWSYGGWLEDRRFIWQGSYLEESGNFIHLGVDFNVPQGTRVEAGAGRVFLADDDGDLDGGWGSRIFLLPEGLDVVLVFAHLQNVRCRAGDFSGPGVTLAEVGGPPWNGNWHPHLHVQAIRRPVFEEILRDRFHELDGYGNPRDLALLTRDFPDPLPLLEKR